jgi:hypothetical protein
MNKGDATVAQDPRPQRLRAATADQHGKTPAFPPSTVASSAVALGLAPLQHARPHDATPDCWCQPIEESPGVWVHRLDPDVEGYVPDLQGVIEGDDGPP